MQTKKAVVKNFSWLYGGSIFRSFSGLFVYILIARYMGPADYGILQFYISIHFIFLSLESIAHPNVVQNLYINYPSKWNKISGSTAGILLVSTSLIMFVVYSDYFFRGKNPEILILVITASTLILRSSNPIPYWYSSQLRASRSIIAQSIGFVISYALSIYFCFTHKNIYYFAFAYSLQFFVTFVIHLIFYREDGQLIENWVFDKETAKDILILSFPFLLSTTLFFIQSRMNMFFIKGLLPEKDLGLYAAANQLSEPWQNVPAALVSSLLPHIIHHIKNKNEEFLKKIFAFQFVTALGICLATVFCSGFFIKLLFSVKYIESIAILKILIWANIFNFWFITQQTIDVEKKTQKFMAYRLCIGLPFSTAISYYLTKNYGVIGSAYAAVISLAFYGFFSNLLFKKTREIMIIQIKSILFWRYLNLEMLKDLYIAFTSKKNEMGSNG